MTKLGPRHRVEFEYGALRRGYDDAKTVSVVVEAWTWTEAKALGRKEAAEITGRKPRSLRWSKTTLL